MILYHYTSGQGLFGIFNSGELHCSNRDFLNDPSERTYFKELVKLIVKDSKECCDIYSTLFNNSFQEAVLSPFDSFVASFSKNDDSLTMWNNYAKGNGYNIGLDIDEIILRNKSDNNHIEKIELIYNQDCQISELADFILSQRDNYSKYIELEEEMNAIKVKDDYYYECSIRQDHLIEGFNKGLYTLQIRYKHFAYEREQEVRIIISENEVEQKTTRFKMLESGVLLEYFSLELDLKADLKSIVLHPLSKRLHLYGAKKFVESKYYPRNVEIRKSIIPFRIV